MLTAEHKGQVEVASFSSLTTEVRILVPSHRAKASQKAPQIKGHFSPLMPQPTNLPTGTLWKTQKDPNA